MLVYTVLPPYRMKNPRRFLIGTVVGFAVSCLIPNGIGLAEAPDTQEMQALEEKLAALREEWSGNQRAYAKEQQRIHQSAEEIRNQLCTMGKLTRCTKVDIRKLARAVAMAETENCTTGVGKSKNNCHGIFACTAQGCAPRTFASPEESYAAFETMWLRKYGNRFPTLADAQRYTGSAATEWYATVRHVYNE